MHFLSIHETRPQESLEQIPKTLSKQPDFESWFGFTPKAGTQQQLHHTPTHLPGIEKEI